MEAVLPHLSVAGSLGCWRRDVCLEQGFTAQIKLQHLYFSVMYYSIHFSKELKQDVSEYCRVQPSLQDQLLLFWRITEVLSSQKEASSTGKYSGLKPQYCHYFKKCLNFLFLFFFFVGRSIFQLLKGIKLFKKGIQEKTNIKINVKLLFLN